MQPANLDMVRTRASVISKWMAERAKVKGTRFWEKKNETKILYLALLLVLLHLHVQDFCLHFSFPKTLFPSFLHHFYPQFLFPPTFSLENVFRYLYIYAPLVFIPSVTQAKVLTLIHTQIICQCRFPDSKCGLPNKSYDNSLC